MDPENITTPEALSAALIELRWTQAELAMRLGVHANSVWGWANGLTPVPGYAKEYLRVCVLFSRAMRRCFCSLPLYRMLPRTAHKNSRASVHSQGELINPHA